MNLSIGLQQAAASRPWGAAILWRRDDGSEASLSYAAFEDQAARIAGGLRSRFGLRPGDRVAMTMANCPEYLPTLYGVWRAGLVAVPINAKLHPKELSELFDDAEAAVIVATPEIAETLVTSRPVIATGDAEFQTLLRSDPVRDVDGAPDDPAWIFFTSGTTGRSKGAVLTVRNLLAMSGAYYADVDFVGPSDVRLHATPMSHGSGVYAIPFVLKGAAHYVLPRFDEEAVFDVLATQRNVCFFAAPTVLKRLTAHPRAGGDLSGLKTVCIGGAPLYVEDCKRALEVFGGAVYQLYGQGEAPMTISNVTKAMYAETDRLGYEAMLGGVGRPRTGCEVAIVDEDWRPLPPGAVGEIATRSDVVMAGYLDNPTATVDALRDGWLKTGDVGVIDEHGMLTLQDRSKDMIISGGMNIYPRQIEEVLLESPLVREVSVVGAPHADWGEEVVAFIEPAPGAAPTAAALDRLCLERLARFKRPKRYEFVDHLPRNNYGKIVKTVLRERLAAQKSDDG